MKVSKALLIAVTYATYVVAHENAYAIPIKITDSTPDYSAHVTLCVGLDGKKYKECTSAARINVTKSLVGKDRQFKKSFDAWNDATGKEWTLVDGGNLPGGQFNVKVFDAKATYYVGGLEIDVRWTYDGADKNDFEWVQGLYSNYTVKPPEIVDSRYKMDVYADGCDNADLLKQCPPLYPKQYVDRSFYDSPRGAWPNSFFNARAFLSKSDFPNHTLTIYEGLSYGFVLDASLPSCDDATPNKNTFGQRQTAEQCVVPEPSPLFFFVAGLLGIGVLRYATTKAHVKH